MSAFNDLITHYLDKGNVEMANRIEDERRMASGLIRACLAKKYMVSIHNGEDWALVKSRNYAEIMDALWQTDEEMVLIRETDGSKVGRFFLVYGNSGEELIADYTDNDACNAIWNELEPLRSKLSR